MKSTLQKIEQLLGLHNTNDVTPWENNFIESVADQISAGRTLSEKRLVTIKNIHEKHFA